MGVLPRACGHACMRARVTHLGEGHRVVEPEQLRVVARGEQVREHRRHALAPPVVQHRVGRQLHRHEHRVEAVCHGEGRGW